MAVSSPELRARLAERDPALLRAVLEASNVSWSDADDGDALARRLVDALWWRTHSPAGQALRPDSLDQLVSLHAERLDVVLPVGDAYTRLQALTQAVLPSGQVVDAGQVPDDVARRLRRPVWGRLAGASAAGTAFGARWLAGRVAAGMVGPIWAVLAQLPWVGPAVIAVRTGAGAVLSLSGPIGVGLALLTLNSALGPRYDKALPLLLGAGLVLRDLPAET